MYGDANDQSILCSDYATSQPERSSFQQLGSEANKHNRCRIASCVDWKIEDTPLRLREAERGMTGVQTPEGSSNNSGSRTSLESSDLTLINTDDNVPALAVSTVTPAVQSARARTLLCLPV
jgi:hypothetical protein